MTSADILRVFVILGCLLAIGLIIAINHPVRRILSFGHVMTRAGVVVVLLSIAYGTIESHLQHIPGASRLVVFAGGLVWLNIGQIALLIERRKGRGHDAAPMEENR